ncbi:DNA repair protein RadC [Vallitalea pronyensis]|uniref:DNA repair protein RadC n=1 Tax=Vallitalea pronyensis TaxID=1348613 RepID=A0A8J8MKS1_9FIRM|nr:DNA repair protein RadC [Vallitalea pronyensis]QUI23331.1 DNA repair protein RadC [Vallitalea pronyensis]
MRVKDLPSSERPYEKFETYGPSALSDAELLAIIIRSGSRKERSIELAQRILGITEQGIRGIYGLSLDDLQQVSGIGRVKSIQIKAIAELSKRLSKYNAETKLKISSPGSIATLYMEEMRYLQQEHLKIVFLDTKNQIIADKFLTVGTVNASLINPREVFIQALRHHAVHVILLHNHPSGDPTPSQEDIAITKRIIEAGDIIGVRLLDHIIIGDGHYISLKERGIV